MERQFFNSKEKRNFINQIKEQYGINELNLDYVFMKDQKDKVYIISNKLKEINQKDFNISSYGLYFARDIGEIRLSVEGSQIIGEYAKKNIIELDESLLKKWMQGLDITMDSDQEGFVLIKHKNNFYGCGKYKNGIILNYVPKERRVKFE
ncbi:MAG: hypothetical protein PHT54_02295 [Candidatus Nanoarchaeia archaeon]|nr:hypothetical protein [Candidatus Nanoarchaeia archaeon]